MLANCSKMMVATLYSCIFLTHFEMDLKYLTKHKTPYSITSYTEKNSHKKESKGLESSRQL